MSEISTSLTIQFNAREIDEPFELVVDDDDQSGSAPVQVAYSQLTSTVCGWGRICYGMTEITPLSVVEPGKKRIKLYCSERVAGTARLMVDGGTVTLVGRRSEEVIETLTFTRENRKRLRYFHDSPDVEVIEQTTFRDLAGNTVDAPRYDQSLGEFYAPQGVIGALVVRFDSGYSLFEVTYDSGQSVASAAQFAEMQSAWQSGNVETAEIPPVRVIALSDWHAAQGSFERKFWPSGAPSISFRSSSSSRDDQSEEEEEEAVEGFYQEVPGTRQTVEERIYHPEDPEQFIDVEKTIYLEARDSTTGRVFKLRLLNNASV
ncbi:MAG: hypothetical protein HQL52_12740 [Magnetococcales bacterium]|nr:hypothetical protein [Magnetococcales bacterium]